MKLPMELTIGEIAVAAGGRVEGPADTKVHSVALSPLEAGQGELAFLFDPSLIKRISECRASAVIVPEGVKTELPRIIVQRPMLALRNLLGLVKPQRFLPPPGVHPTAVIDPTVELGKDVAIGPFVVIGPHSKIGDNTAIMSGCVIGGHVVIGSDCQLYPRGVISDYVKIGARVRIQAGANIGTEGLAYVTEKVSNLERMMAGSTDFSDEPNPHLRIPQIGTVVIEDDVEIGGNTVVDRATMGATVIRAGSKIDSMVIIAHNCKIGREVLMVANTGVAGSVTVGDRTVLAGHVGIKDHLKIGKDVIVEAKSGVMKDVPDHGVVCGSPAVPVRDFFTQVAHVKKLPRIYDELKELQKKVARLEEALNERQLVGQKG